MDRDIPVSPIYTNVMFMGNHIVSCPVSMPIKEDVIIDDIYDSGKTYKDLKVYFDNFPMVFLYSKKEYFKTDLTKNIFVGRQILTDDYLYLPFEKQPEDHYPLSH